MVNFMKLTPKNILNNCRFLHDRTVLINLINSLKDTSNSRLSI